MYNLVIDDRQLGYNYMSIETYNVNWKWQIVGYLSVISLKIAFDCALSCHWNSRMALTYD